MPTYAERIKALMSEKGTDITELARELGVTYQAVRKVIELGGKFGSTNNLKAAAFFNVSPSWLNTGNGQRDAQYIVTGKDLSDEALKLAALFDLIPESHILRRATAYSGAVAAIASVLKSSDSTP